MIQKALDHQVAIFSAHTNLDRAKDGVNDVLASKIGLRNTQSLPNEVLSGKSGFGRMGNLVQPIPLTALVNNLKQALWLDYVRVAGNLDLRVETVAVCSGSGSSMVSAFLDAGCGCVYQWRSEIP